MAAWRRFEDAPQSRSDQRAWIFGITRNCLLNARRGLNRGDVLAVRIGEALLAHPPTPAADTDLLALRADLARAWRALAPDEQEVWRSPCSRTSPRRRPAWSGDQLGCLPPSIEVESSRVLYGVVALP